MASNGQQQEQFQKANQKQVRDSITLSLNDSFFKENGRDTTVEEYFQNIDE